MAPKDLDVVGCGGDYEWTSGHDHLTVSAAMTTSPSLQAVRPTSARILTIQSHVVHGYVGQADSHFFFGSDDLNSPFLIDRQVTSRQRFHFSYWAGKSMP